MDQPNQHRRRGSQLPSPTDPQKALPLVIEEVDSSPQPSWLGRILEIYPNFYTTSGAILAWYVCSTAISLYNKWMFSGDRLGFEFPIIITGFHQLILTGLAIITLWLVPSMRLKRGYTKIPTGSALDLDESTAQACESSENASIGNPPLSYVIHPWDYVKTIFPCSLTSALDIGLGNTAIRFIPLSVFTMVKTSSLIFVLFWGVLLRLERLTGRIVAIVVVMTGGVILMMWGQGGSKAAPDTPHEDIPALLIRALANPALASLGIILVLASACFSGLRWALTQILLKKNPRTTNPILTMVYLSPGMALALFILGSLVEGFPNFVAAPIWSIMGTPVTLILVLIPGILAFLMTIAEFVLLQNASLLTLSVAGIFKELVTIFLSWVVFDDPLNAVNVLGLVVTVADIAAYNYYRLELSKEDDEAVSDDDPFVDLELDNITR